MNLRTRWNHPWLVAVLLCASLAAPPARAEQPLQAGAGLHINLDGLALHGGPFDPVLRQGSLLPALAQDSLATPSGQSTGVELRQTSFWRKLHPILGWTSVVAFAANVFIGPALKGMADANQEPNETLNIVHGSIAGISTLAWIGSLSALLAAPPEGGSQVKPAHKVVGWIQVPLFVGTIVMGEMTRATIDANPGHAALSTNFSLVHDWFVLSTLIIYTATALLSL